MSKFTYKGALTFIIYLFATFFFTVCFVMAIAGLVTGA